MKPFTNTYGLGSHQEAIHKIYARNHFIFSTDLLLRQADRFFIPQHRSLLTNVTLVWEMLGQSHPTRSAEARESYNALWTSLGPSMLPALRRLRVVIEAEGELPHAIGPSFSQAWFDPVVAFAASRPLDFFEFAIPKPYLERFDAQVVDGRTFHIRRTHSRKFLTYFELQCTVSCFGGGQTSPYCRLMWQSFGPGEPIHDARCPGCVNTLDEDLTAIFETSATEN